MRNSRLLVQTSAAYLHLHLTQPPPRSALRAKSGSSTSRAAPPPARSRFASTFIAMNPRSPKRPKPALSSMQGDFKRMRQSTLSFGKPSDAAASAADAPAGTALWRTVAPSVMVFETEDWHSKATSDSKSRAVAAFDMDSTLIKTKSGAKFARHATDLVLWSADVLPKLRQCADDGCVLVIFSNQNGVSKGRPSKEMIRARVEEVARILNLPIAVYMAVEKNRFRKPCVGMWELFVERLGGDERVDRLTSFFVGDAAGRKKDFSDSDLKFSINTDLTFHTPENFFDGTPYSPASLSVGKFNPNAFVTGELFRMGELDGDAEMREMLEEIVTPVDMVARLMDDGIVGEDTAPKNQCMVLLCGSPASGKSTFAKRYLISKGYVWVNQDSSTPSKCLKTASQALSEGKSVVVDNT
eukprot:IDg6593t1